MKVKLITVTPDAEQTMLYIARVSSKNQDSRDLRLLAYCIHHQHWSVFEHAHMTIEITTSRTIGRQILRHKSFSYSEMSQRYTKSTQFETYEARQSGSKNRQSSTTPVSKARAFAFRAIQKMLQAVSNTAYRTASSMGVADECARFMLLETATTRMYMTGNIRSWIHYIQLRTKEDTQAEHREIAIGIAKIFQEVLPTLSQVVISENI